MGPIEVFKKSFSDFQQIQVTPQESFETRILWYYQTPIEVFDSKVTFAHKKRPRPVFKEVHINQEGIYRNKYISSSKKGVVGSKDWKKPITYKKDGIDLKQSIGI